MAITATDIAGNVGSDGTTDELTVSQNVISFDAASITSTSFVASWIQAEDVQNYTLDVSRTADFSSFVPGFEALDVAAELGLPRDELEAGMRSDTVREVVEASYEIAQTLGLSGTPSYVIGDKVEFGAVGVDALRAAVNQARCGADECS